jgi:hypothetical protein
MWIKLVKNYITCICTCLCGLSIYETPPQVSGRKMWTQACQLSISTLSLITHQIISARVRCKRTVLWVSMHRGESGCSSTSEFWKLVFFSNAFDNLLFLEFFFCLPLNCLINFIEKKIFNIAHNKIIIQRYQNIKFRRRKLYSSTWLSITLSFILLLFLI